MLNYPRNGLGRDGCLGTGPSKLRGGRSGRFLGAKDEAQEDEDEEEDEWREQLPSKSRQDRGDMKGMQYWSHRDPDRAGEDRGGPGPLGGVGLGVHGGDAEVKKLMMKNVVRSAFFLVPLVCAMLVVLLCAFLIPCQKGGLEKKPQWERALGDAGGNTNYCSLFKIKQKYKFGKQKNICFIALKSFLLVRKQIILTRSRKQETFNNLIIH